MKIINYFCIASFLVMWAFLFGSPLAAFAVTVVLWGILRLFLNPRAQGP